MDSLDNKIYRFESGETLIYSRDESENLTDYSIGFLGGSYKNGENYGIAHFVEHMLMRGTGNLNKQEYAKNILSKNIQKNAYTHSNVIFLNTKLRSDFFADELSTDFLRITNKTFNENDINIEREILKEELKLLVEDSYSVMLKNNFNQNLSDQDLSNIVYPAGSAESMDKVNKQMIEDFVFENCVSENLVICVKSNLDFETVKQIVENKVAGKTKSDACKINNVLDLTGKYSNMFFPYYIENQKTITLNVKLRFDSTNTQFKILSNIFEKLVINNCDLNSILFEKLRKNNGLVYYANCTPKTLYNNAKEIDFVLKTSANKLNIVIEKLGEIVTDLRENGISEEQYNNLAACFEVEKSMQKKTYVNTVNMMVNYSTAQDIFPTQNLNSLNAYSLNLINKLLKNKLSNCSTIINVCGSYDKDSLYSVEKLESIFKKQPNKIFFIKSIKEIFVKENNVVRFIEDDETFTEDEITIISDDFEVAEYSKYQDPPYDLMLKNVLHLLGNNAYKKYMENYNKKAANKIKRIIKNRQNNADFMKTVDKNNPVYITDEELQNLQVDMNVHFSKGYEIE